MNNETLKPLEQLNNEREDGAVYGLETLNKINQIAGTVIGITDDPSIIALAAAIQDHCHTARCMYHQSLHGIEIPF